MTNFQAFGSTLAVVALAAAAPVVQAASATASMTGIYLQVFDLNPLDNITAAVTFTDGVSVYGSADDGANPINSFNLGGAAGTALSGSALAGAVLSSAAVTVGDVYTLGAGPGATASVSATGVGSFAYSQALALYSTGVTVTANTLVVLSATAQVAAAATLGELSNAAAIVQLSDGNVANYSVGQAYAYFAPDGSNSAVPGPLTAQATFANLTAGSVVISAYAYTSASAGGVAVVPEPDTYGLMASGLLALAYVARRRSQR